MSSQKRRLSEEEIKIAYSMLEQKKSLKAMAKHFVVNKTSILKSLGIWNSEEKIHTDGTKYKFIRGKISINIPTKKEGEVKNG